MDLTSRDVPSALETSPSLIYVDLADALCEPDVGAAAPDEGESAAAGAAAGFDAASIADPEDIVGLMSQSEVSLARIYVFEALVGRFPSAT